MSVAHDAMTVHTPDAMTVRAVLRAPIAQLRLPATALRAVTVLRRAVRADTRSAMVLRLVVRAGTRSVMVLRRAAMVALRAVTIAAAVVDSPSVQGPGVTVRIAKRMIVLVSTIRWCPTRSPRTICTPRHAMS